MRSTLFKTLSIVALALTLGACSADSDDKGDASGPRRKLEPSEIENLTAMMKTIDGIEAADYPVDRTFGQSQDSDNPNGERMFEMLKVCTKTDEASGTTIKHALNGTPCPISFTENAEFTQTGDEQNGRSQRVYSVLDPAYIVTGHMLNYDSMMIAKMSPSEMEVNVGTSFTSKDQGSGLLTLKISNLSTKVSETRLDIHSKTEATISGRHSACFEDDTKSTPDKKSACLPNTKFTLVIDGYTETHGDEIELVVTSMACYVNDVQFDCAQAPGFKKMKTDSMSAIKMQVRQNLKN